MKQQGDEAEVELQKALKEANDIKDYLNLALKNAEESKAQLQVELKDALKALEACKEKTKTGK